MKVYRYVVSGHGQFPLDMLRYDRAAPYRQEDVAMIEQVERGLRDVELVGWMKPTDGRWASFGWRVASKVTKTTFSQ